MVAVQCWWRTVMGRNATIRQETIKNCHSKLLTTGSVTDARRSGRPSTSRSEENVALVRDMFTRSPRKSTRQAARESGLSRHTVVESRLIWGGFFFKLLLNLGRCKTFQNTKLSLINEATVAT